MKGDATALRDDASDLWDRPPRPPVRCPGCGTNAEPYEGRFCWRCCHDGQRAFIERTTTADDLRAATGDRCDG